MRLHLGPSGVARDAHAARGDAAARQRLRSLDEPRGSDPSAGPSRSPCSRAASWYGARRAPPGRTRVPGRSTAYRLGAKHPAATIARQHEPAHARRSATLSSGDRLHPRPLDAAAGGAARAAGGTRHPWRRRRAAVPGVAPTSALRARGARASLARPASATTGCPRSAAGGRPRPDSPHVGVARARLPRLRRPHGRRRSSRAGLAALLALAAERPTAIMCAEAVPWRCHRQLIADALVARGVDGAARHRRRSRRGRTAEPFARLEGDRIVYDAGQLAAAAEWPLRETLCHDPRRCRQIVHVVSHGPTCLDGVTAAAAVARYYGDHAQVHATLREQQRDRRRARRRCAPSATASASSGSPTSPGASRPPTQHLRALAARRRPHLLDRPPPDRARAGEGRPRRRSLRGHAC